MCLSFQSDLISNIQYNRELASRYRQLRNDYILMKNDVLNRLEEKNKVENAIKDGKQVRRRKMCGLLTVVLLLVSVYKHVPVIPELKLHAHRYTKI